MLHTPVYNYPSISTLSLSCLYMVTNVLSPKQQKGVKNNSSSSRQAGGVPCSLITQGRFKYLSTSPLLHPQVPFSSPRLLDRLEGSLPGVVFLACEHVTIVFVLCCSSARDVRSYVCNVLYVIYVYSSFCVLLFSQRSL